MSSICPCLREGWRDGLSTFDMEGGRKDFTRDRGRFHDRQKGGILLSQNPALISLCGDVSTCAAAGLPWVAWKADGYLTFGVPVGAPGFVFEPASVAADRASVRAGPAAVDVSG